MAPSGKSVVRNGFAIVGGNFLNKALSIILLVYLTWYLEPAEFGRYAFVMAYAAFFGIFTDLGLNTYMTREICAGNIDPSEGFAHSIVLRLFATFIAASVMLTSFVVLRYPFETVRLAAAASLLLFLSFRGLFFRRVFDIPFQVRLRMNVPAMINFLSEVLCLLVVIFLIYRGASLFVIVLSMALANIPGFAAAAYLSARLIRPVFAFDPAVWKRLLVESMPLAVSVFLEGLFIVTPLVFLSLFSTEESMAFYGLPFRLVSSLWIVPVAVMISLLPGMSRGAKVGTEEAGRGFLKGMKVVLAAGLPVAFVTAYLSPRIIMLLAGEGYMEASGILSFMIWGTLMYFINTVFFYTFTSIGKQGLNAAVWTVISVLSIIICFVTVPAYGHSGAAAGFVLPLAAGVALNTYLALREKGAGSVPILARFLFGAVTVFVLIAGAALAAG